MEKLASVLIIFGSLSWLFSILFLGAKWQPQMISAGIIVAGIVTGHVWEEIFWKKDGESEDQLPDFDG